jgi:hypothetical protein
MQYRWTNKKIDLSLLSKHVEAFLQSRDFKSRMDKTENGYVIVGTFEEADGSSRSVKIRIDGASDNFSIEFVAGEDKRVLSTLSPIASFLGVGIFLRQKLDQINFYDKIEEEFWKFINESIASLVGSASGF